MTYRKEHYNMGNNRNNIANMIDTLKYSEEFKKEYPRFSELLSQIIAQ